MATVVTTDVKLLRCNGQPWGFRLSGGVDFTFPLTAVRVRHSLISECYDNEQITHNSLGRSPRIKKSD